MKIMTKEEFKEMELVYIQWLHEHPKGDYSYKAFSHMRRTLEFAKYWSKLHQPTVIGRFCKECGNTKILQGNGIIEPLCTCNTESKTYL